MNRTNQMLFTSIVCIAVLALSGCGDSKQVTEVKALPFSYDSRYVQDPNMTVGQVLDTRKICDSVNWSVQQTDRNQTFVEYDCIYKGISNSSFIEKEKALGRQAGLVSVNDVYQWTFGPSGHPDLSYVGVIMHYKDGHSNPLKDSVQNIDDLAIMRMAVKNKVTNFDQAFSTYTGLPVPVKPAAPITDTTYANTLTALYPGKSAKDAARSAYWWRNALVQFYSIDSLGYPRVINGSHFKKVLFPVNPKDVQFAIKADPDNRVSKSLHLSPNKLICVDELCYDKKGYVVGLAPASIQAKETSPRPSEPAQQTPTASTADDPAISAEDDSGWPADTPCIAKKRKAFIKEAESKHYASNVSIYQAQEWAAECKAQ